MPFLGQGAADVVDRQILFAQRDDLLAAGIGFRGSLRAFGDRGKKIASRAMAETVDQNAEAAWGIPETSGGLGAGESFDEEGPESLILALVGVGRFEEEPGVKGGQKA